MTQYYADETEDVKVKVPTFSGDKIFMYESEVLMLLASIDSEDKYKHNIYYIGGTLCIDIGNDSLMFNVKDCLTFAIQAQVAQFYLNHKNENYAFWAEAQEIVARSNKIEEVK